MIFQTNSDGNKMFQVFDLYLNMTCEKSTIEIAKESFSVLFLVWYVTVAVHCSVTSVTVAVQCSVTSVTVPVQCSVTSVTVAVQCSVTSVTVAVQCSVTMLICP